MAGDFNLDGKADVAWSSFFQYRVVILRGDGSGGLAASFVPGLVRPAWSAATSISMGSPIWPCETACSVP